MSTDQFRQPLRIAFCGGGSAGHLNPAAAVANLLPEGTSGLFCVSGRSIDQIVLKTFPQTLIDSGPGTWQVLTQPVTSSTRKAVYLFQVLRSLWMCLRKFRRSQIQVVIGMGGFASLPGLLAALILRLPIILFEPNTVPGRVNRKFARFSRMTLVGMTWQKTQQTSWPSPVTFIGIPIRQKIPITSESQTAPSNQILIMGGSLGADRLNKLVVAALSQLSKMLIENQVSIIHQTGIAHVAQTKVEYEDTPVPCAIVDFLQDSFAEIQKSRLVISRAGAVSLAEIEACGTPAILVPLSTSADDHQQRNAHQFTQDHPAIVINETAPDAVQQMTEAINKMLHANSRSSNLKRISAAQKFVSYLLDNEF